MSLDDKARRLAEDLQKLLEGSEAAERESVAASDKLTAQEIRVLRCVGREKCCIMSGIADAIRLSLSGVTGLIDRLVEKKLVRRDRSAEDRRVVEVVLTDEGKRLHEAAQDGRTRFARELLAGLKADEQEALLGALRKAAGRLEGGS